MSTVIKIENVSKKYQLGLIGTSTLKGDIQRWWYNMRGLPDPTLMIGQENNLSAAHRTPHTAHPDDFIWALKDINFEVQQGEVLGIIGKNGAGKSTLLKLLSRVTAPTTGTIKVKGRIASLLEVGTGFHPELTGRENIFLNGAILGMTKTEIQRKLDEIVDFAGIEKYIDTPVKRYSSGMYVRLAFAVAAHLEPEILIVDEVLAVGDAEFQKKALGKMQDVSTNDGRTVLFVSHNMAAVKNLCSNSILLKNGRIEFIGDTETTIKLYLQNKSNRGGDLNDIQRKGTKDLLITEFYVEETLNENNRSILSGEDITLVFKYEKRNNVKLDQVSLGFSIHNVYGDTLAILYSDFSNKYFVLKENTGSVKCRIKRFPFSKGRYLIGLRVINQGIELDYPQEHIGVIEIDNGDFYGTGKSDYSGLGPFLIKGTWENNYD